MALLSNHASFIICISVKKGHLNSFEELSTAEPFSSWLSIAKVSSGDCVSIKTIQLMLLRTYFLRCLVNDTKHIPYPFSVFFGRPRILYAAVAMGKEISKGMHD